MRFALFITLSLACAGICQAQSAAPGQAPLERVNSAAPSATDAIEKRTERIHIEDAGVRIDELRVGGETRSISVQPKGGLPTYQVQPGSGERSWKILGF